MSTYFDVKVVGHKKGLFLMERADPVFLLMGLPTIPVMLVLGKMIRWEEYLLSLWHRYSGQQLRGKQHIIIINTSFLLDTRATRLILIYSDAGGQWVREFDSQLKVSGFDPQRP